MIKSKVIYPEQFSRFEIVLNSPKQSMTSVYAQQHCSLLMDGPFFSWSTFRATCHMKRDGITDTKPPYSVSGIVFDNGEFPTVGHLPNTKQNGFTNSVLIVDGKKQPLVWHKDADGTPAKPRFTSRPALGVKDGKLMCYANTYCTLPGLQDILFRAGWDFAIMLDGGGSTEWRDSDKGLIYSARLVPYYLGFWLLPEGVERKMISGFGAVNVFSVKKHGNAYLTRNFQVKEFAQKSIDTVFISPTTPNILQDVRTWAGASVKILSGYRNDEHNAEVDGAVYSQHKYGHAADISVKGKTPARVYDYLCKRYPGKYGFGLYSWGVHVDDRATAARWKG